MIHVYGQNLKLLWFSLNNNVCTIQIVGHCIATWYVSCKANGDRNQLLVWRDSDLIVE